MHARFVETRAAIRIAPLAGSYVSVPPNALHEPLPETSPGPNRSVTSGPAGTGRSWIATSRQAVPVSRSGWLTWLGDAGASRRARREDRHGGHEERDDPH
jgi:hypothetical protein